MHAAEVQAYLTHLAAERNVAASTQNQALNALVFLYREVLGLELGAIGKIERPTRGRKLPAGLTKEEVQRLLAAGRSWTLPPVLARCGIGTPRSRGSGVAIPVPAA